MAFNLAVQLYPETLRTLAYGSISGTYARIGSAFANPIKLLVLQNETDVLLTFSWDGINDHLVLPSMGQIVLDVGSNMSTAAGELYFGQGKSIYVSGDPGSGSVYLSVFYGLGASNT